MNLPEEDITYLQSKGIDFEIIDRPNGLDIILKDYNISDNFTTDKVDVLVKVPAGYPMAQLDMFWVHPEVYVKSTGLKPPQADVMENIDNLNWQRFSRHYRWETTFTLATHINVINKSLR